MQDTPVERKEAMATECPWPPDQGEWTYEDWLKLPDDGYRYEVIDGVLYMIPPPLIRHQRGLVRFIDLFLAFLKLYPVGEVLIAPIGVRLPNQPVPLQPDIVFVRAERLDIIHEHYIEGTPDLLVEILSPSNWLYDRREKMRVYQEAGVPEYWIVGIDHGIGHFMLFEVDSAVRVPAPPMPKSPQTSSAASDRKSVLLPLSHQAG